MYSPKPPGDHRPQNVMNYGGTLAEATMVAAARRKLSPSNSPETSHTFESKNLTYLLICK